MTSNISDRNGRALEYIISKRISESNLIVSTRRTIFNNSRDKAKYDQLPNELKQEFLRSADFISTWVLKKFENSSNILLDRQDDASGSVADIILSSQSTNINLSIKHNHQAYKHQRPHSFAIQCGYAKDSRQDKFHRGLMSDLENTFRLSNKKFTKFNQCNLDDLYYNVCIACCTSLNKWLREDSDLAPNLFKYLTGQGNYYKLIVYSKPKLSVRIEEFFSIVLPSSLKTYTFNKNKLIINFDNGWDFELRIHTAATLISNSGKQLSLKFDTQKLSGNIISYTEFL